MNAMLGANSMVFHAVASPYRDRSHFEGQNVLENGLRSRWEAPTAGSIGPWPPYPSPGTASAP